MGEGIAVQQQVMARQAEGQVRDEDGGPGGADETAEESHRRAGLFVRCPLEAPAAASRSVAEIGWVRKSASGPNRSWPAWRASPGVSQTLTTRPPSMRATRPQS